MLWDEICVVNDLLLRSSRGAVQGCWRVMGPGSRGEKGLCGSPCRDWVTLRRQRSWTPPTTPPRVSSAQLLEKMRETSTQRKQEEEAFELCLPRKQVPRPPPRTGFAAVAAAARGRQGDARPAPRPGAGRGDQQGNNKAPGASTLSPRWLRNAALPNPRGVGISGLPDVPRPSSPLPPPAKRRRERFRAAAPVRFPGASSHGPPR